jgi:hypothetical protein
VAGAANIVALTRSLMLSVNWRRCLSVAGAANIVALTRSLMLSVYQQICLSYSLLNDAHKEFTTSGAIPLHVWGPSWQHSCFYVEHGLLSNFSDVHGRIPLSQRWRHPYSIKYRHRSLHRRIPICMADEIAHIWNARMLQTLGGTQEWNKKGAVLSSVCWSEWSKEKSRIVKG